MEKNKIQQFLYINVHCRYPCMFLQLCSNYYIQHLYILMFINIMVRKDKTGQNVPKTDRFNLIIMHPPETLRSLSVYLIFRYRWGKVTLIR